MPTVTMPQLGESVEQGTIGKWLKNVGDHVRVGDPLVEIVTDKVNAEVPSPFEGTLTRIHVAEGETVANDAAIAEVEADAAAAADVKSRPAPADAEPAATASPDTPASRDTAATRDSAAAAEAATIASAAGGGTASQAAAEHSTASPGTSVATIDVEVPAGAPPTQDGPRTGGNGVGAAPTTGGVPVEIPPGVRMTPAVRRLAREMGVDVSAITGSGLGGRITREDIEKAAASGAIVPGPAAAPTAQPAPAQAPRAATTPAIEATSPVAEGDSLKKLSPLRKAIVTQMTRWLDVPTAYITIEVDMTPVVRRRTRANAEYKAREGMNLSFVAFVTKACVEALRKHPDINAHWTEEGHWRRKAINVGIAVAVPDGLVVPVIFDADRLSLHGLNTAINDLAVRARNKKLMPDELKGSTFTVDNTGWTGSILTLPIINVPEVAIVTMEKIVKRPVVLEDHGDAIAVRSMMNMCIAIDHRATDGAQAGEFLADVRGWLESVDDDTPIW